MQIDTQLRIRSLVRTYPVLEEVLGWHDIEVDESVLPMRLESLCDSVGLDVDEVIHDLLAALKEAGIDINEMEEQEEEEEEEDDDTSEVPNHNGDDPSGLTTFQSILGDDVYIAEDDDWD